MRTLCIIDAGYNEFNSKQRATVGIRGFCVLRLTYEMEQRATLRFDTSRQVQQTRRGTHENPPVTTITQRKQLSTLSWAYVQTPI